MNILGKATLRLSSDRLLELIWYADGDYPGTGLDCVSSKAYRITATRVDDDSGDVVIEIEACGTQEAKP